jgi:putative adhesin
MTLTTLALTLLLAQGATPRTGPPQTDETVPVQRGARLLINNFAGDVVIHTWDRDAVHVTARHQARTRVTIRPGAAGLNVSASGSMGPQGSVDYDITAPAWMPVRVEGTYNFVTVDGAQNEVFVNTVRGDVTIKGGSGVVTAKSVEGEVHVEAARGKISVSSVNEKVVIADTSGEITAESINGAVTMTGIDSKSVDASTVNGDIVFEGKLLDGGHYSFGTHNGNLLLGLPDNVNATFTIRTYQGSFSTDLPLEGVSRADLQRGRRVTTTLGSGSADVSLETFGGAIRLRKGSAGRARVR